MLFRSRITAIDKCIYKKLSSQPLHSKYQIPKSNTGKYEPYASKATIIVKKQRKFVKLRVRLFWVKMISGNHFHPNPHVWLQRKIQFSGNHLPIDQNLRL